MQESQIFQGTLLENLDPLGKVDSVLADEVVLRCGLDRLKGNQEPRQWREIRIESDGNDLSAGERQLINIARAIMK